MATVPTQDVQTCLDALIERAYGGEAVVIVSRSGEKVGLVPVAHDVVSVPLAGQVSSKID